MRQLLILLMLFLPGAAEAADTKPPPPLVLVKDLVYSRIMVAKLSTAAVQKRMKSGLTQRLLYKLSLFRKGELKPLAGVVRYCKVTYDLWDERYEMVCLTPGRQVKKKFKKIKKLMEALSLVFVPVLRKSEIVPDADYSLKLNVQLNPVSPKLLRKIRLWMRQSESAAVGTNYVGSFLSLFISKDIGGSDLNVDVTSAQVRGQEISTK